MGDIIEPKYNYGCETCDREWSQWSSMDNPTVECPHCFSGKVKKMPTNFTVIKKKHGNEKVSRENVIDHIEENREILKNMRNKAVSEDILKND